MKEIPLSPRLKPANLILSITVALSLLALGLYPYIPPKRFVVLPSGQGSQAEKQVENRALLQAYSPHEITSAYWKDENTTHFACENKVLEGQYAVCALSIYFGEDYTKGVDLSAYDTLVLDAEYFGDVSKLRIFMRNFNPEYSDVRDDNSAKYMSLTLATSELAVPGALRIGLQQLSVAEWWLEQHEPDRKYLPLEFGNITMLRLDFGEFLARGSYLDLRINELYFEGPWVRERDWYRGILLIWIGIAIGYLGSRFFSVLKHNHGYQKEITRLAADRALLAHKSQKYQTLSWLDPLTNLFNRLGMEEQMQTIFDNQAARPAGLIVMDIDHFKLINDQYGHDVGDSILKTVAGLLRANIRDQDILARWGGEEFVLITPQVTPDIAWKLAEKFRLLIERHVFEPQNPVELTSSFGVTLIMEDEPFDQAFKRADRALYEAKRLGRNRTVLDNNVDGST